MPPLSACCPILPLRMERPHAGRGQVAGVLLLPRCVLCVLVHRVEHVQPSPPFCWCPFAWLSVAPVCALSQPLHGVVRCSGAVAGCLCVCNCVVCACVCAVTQVQPAPLAVLAGVCAVWLCAVWVCAVVCCGCACFSACVLALCVCLLACAGAGEMPPPP